MQKGQFAHSTPDRKQGVVGLQQNTYAHLIHNRTGQHSGKLVGDLWSRWVQAVFIPYGEFRGIQYAKIAKLQAMILSKFAVAHPIVSERTQALCCLNCVENIFFCMPKQYKSD